MNGGFTPGRHLTPSSGRERTVHSVHTSRSPVIMVEMKKGQKIERVIRKPLLATNSMPGITWTCLSPGPYRDQG